MVFVQKVYLDFVGKCVQNSQKVVCVVSYLYQSLHLFSYGGIKWEGHSKGGKGYLYKPFYPVINHMEAELREFRR